MGRFFNKHLGKVTHTAWLARVTTSALNAIGKASCRSLNAAISVSETGCRWLAGFDELWNLRLAEVWP